MEPHAKTPPPPVTATQFRLEHVSDAEFVVEPVSTSQPQALNENPSIV